MVDYWPALECERSKLWNELTRIGIRPLSIKVCDYGHDWAVRTDHGTAILPSATYVDVEDRFYCASCHCLVTHDYLFSLRYALHVPWRRKFLEVAICETCADMPGPELESIIRDTLLLRRNWDAWASRVEAEMWRKE